MWVIFVVVLSLPPYHGERHFISEQSFQTLPACLEGAKAFEARLAFMDTGEKTTVSCVSYDQVKNRLTVKQ